MNGNGNKGSDGILRFETNVPVEVALAYADGKLVEGRYGDQWLYTLTDGRRMYVPPFVAQEIGRLEIAQKEPFWICKRQVRNGRSTSTRWEVTRAEGATRESASSVVVPFASANGPEVTTAAEKPTAIQTATGTAPKMPGAGPAVASAMAGALVASVNALLVARAYAQKKGWELQFNEEDVRAIGSTIFIQVSKQLSNGGGVWQQ